jgi:hypothetical protein
VVRGTPVLVADTLRSAGDVARVADRVRGRVVLLGAVPNDPERLAERGRRWTDAQLDSLAQLTDPGSPRDYWDDAGDYPAAVARRQAVYVALARAGALAVLAPSRNAHAPMVGAYQAYDTDLRDAPPALFVARDDYARLVNLVRLAGAAGRAAPEVALSVRRGSTRRARAPTRRASTSWPSCRGATRGCARGGDGGRALRLVDGRHGRDRQRGRRGRRARGRCGCSRRRARGRGAPSAWRSGTARSTRTTSGRWAGCARTSATPRRCASSPSTRG